MGVGPVRTRLGDGAFRVFGKAVHPEWFSVRAHERFALGPWEADVRIVEGGHVVAFSTAGGVVTEVLGARDAALPAGGLLVESPIDGEDSVSLRPIRRVSYQACHEVERVDPEIFRHLCDEAATDPGPGRLFHAFAASSRLAPRPIVHVRVDRLPRGVSVQTFHSFPDELAVLRSQSLFEIDPA